MSGTKPGLSPGSEWTAADPRAILRLHDEVVAETKRRPPGVPRDLWRAYGPNYPGGYARWLLREAERVGRGPHPAPSAAPGEVIDLTDYWTPERQATLRAEASALKSRVDAIRSRLAS